MSASTLEFTREPGKKYPVQDLRDLNSGVSQHEKTHRAAGQPVKLRNL